MTQTKTRALTEGALMVAAEGGGLDSWFRVVPFCLSTRRTACTT